MVHYVLLQLIFFLIIPRFLQCCRWGAYSLYLLTRNPRYLTGSRLRIAPNHVTGRLIWALRNIPNLKVELENNNVMFGTIDSWLLYKLTDRKLHVTDITNASATGFFDPFVSQWGSWAKTLLGIPLRILPEVVANDFAFGSTAEEVFGVAVPIGCVVS